MKPAVTIRARLALGVAAITVLVVLAVAAVQFLALRSFLVGAEYERLELLLPRLEQTLTTIPASSTGPYVLNTLPRTVDVRVIREGRVVAVTPEFPAISLALPIGRARRAGHDVLISTFNLNGTLATAQLASDVLGVVNPLRAYLRSLAVAVPVSAALAALLCFLLAGRLLRPLERLTAAAAAIGRGGHLRAALPGADRGDEVGRLAGVLQTSFGQVAEVREREETFTYAAAHDLRSPLTAMKTRLQGALSGPRSEAELREELREVLSDLERMRRLSEQLLLLARGERDIQRRPLELSRLAGEAVDRTRELAPDLPLEFGTAGLTWILGDEALLSPLLDNLIGNSLRYGGGAAMRMTVTGTPSGVALSMVDSGPGVPPAALPHLTTAFYQVGAARSGQGNGLGLAIAQRVAQLHGARLDLVPVDPSGLRVTVTFPQTAQRD